MHQNKEERNSSSFKLCVHDQRTSVKGMKEDNTYFMNEGCQRLLVTAAAADEEAADGSPSTIGLHRQTVRQEQPSCTTDRKGEL